MAEPHLRDPGVEGSGGVDQPDDQARVRGVAGIGEVDEDIPGDGPGSPVHHRPVFPLFKDRNGDRVHRRGHDRAFQPGHVDEPPVAVVDPDLFERGVQPHQVFPEAPVVRGVTAGLGRIAGEPELEEVAVVGRGQVGVLPQYPACRLRHDAIRHERIAEPDPRYPVVKGGEFPEVEAEVRGVGGVLDDAALVDDVDVHLPPEFLPDPGEVHGARVPPGALVLGEDRTEPLRHPGVQRAVEEFQPRVHKTHRLGDALPRLLPEQGIPGGHGLLDLPAVQDRDQPDHGERDQDHDEQQVCAKTATPPPAAARRRHGLSPSPAFRRVNRMAVPHPGRSSTHILPPYRAISVRQM